ncbi:hypothetical protein E2562_030389 [Oryza meyeriana var. granulata]|uniref:Uncharacterized protein n=1 Tax=Oryza meyeriana var. granulata TaxID=110450 RepID=A0A6G1FE74_9ORYZ|nr:hypothetical protein E2562_030389 [Oryza meyeriana var. granulata]
MCDLAVIPSAPVAQCKLRSTTRHARLGQRLAELEKSSHRRAPKVKNHVLLPPEMEELQESRVLLPPEME